MSAGTGVALAKFVRSQLDLDAAAE